MNKSTAIKTAITTVIEDAQVILFDPRNDGRHFEAIVVSERFSNIPLFKQHQMVMKSLKSAFEGFLHAISIKTFTPECWESKKTEFNLEEEYVE